MSVQNCRMMNWDHLKVFLAVARTGTASAAAKQLSVNHTTVIRRIDALEQSLGIKLFMRLQQGYQLTDDGLSVLQSARGIEADALALERQIKGKGAEPAGKLLISHPVYSLLDLSDVMADFCRHYPQVEITAHSSEDASNLNRMEADVAIRLTDNPPPLAVGRPIGRMHFGIYGHRDYLQVLDASPRPDSVDWVLWSGSAASDLPAVKQPDKQLLGDIQASIVLRTNSIETLVAAINRGMGVGPMNRQVAAQHPDLVELPFAHLLQQANEDAVGVWVLTHRDMKSSATIKAFVRHVTEAFQRSDYTAL